MKNGTRDAIIGLMLVVALGSLFLAKGTPGNHKLYRYYPQSTGFYLELAAGDKLTQRFLNYLDHQASTADTPVLQGMPHGALDRSVNQAIDASTDRQRKFRKAFLEKFNSTFDPYFSIGSWQGKAPPADAQPTSTGTTADNGEALIIFPLKKDQRKQSLPELIQRFEQNVSDYEEKTFGPGKAFSYMVHRDSKSAVAVLEGNFLIANTEPAMLTTLAHFANKEPNVFDEPINKEYIAKLDKHREGTFLLNNRVATEAALRLHRNMPQGQGMNEATMKQVMNVLPVVVGAVDLKHDNQLAVRLLSPLMLGGLNPEFQADLKNLYNHAEALDQASRLPQGTSMFLAVAGLDRWFDFYANHFASPQQIGGVKMMQVLLGKAGIDFRQDVVGLLSDRAVLAAGMTNKSVMLLLKKTPKKEAALKKINGVLAHVAKPRMVQINGETLNTLVLPARGIPLRLGYGPVQDSIVIAPELNLNAAVQASQGKVETLGKDPVYRNLTHSMPEKASVMAYVDMREVSEGLAAQGRPQPVFQTLAFSIWVTPQEKSKDQTESVDLLQGQVNIELPPEVQRTPVAQPHKQPPVSP